MAFNQIPNQNQAMTSPPLPLITSSQMMNSQSHVTYQQPQQQPDHANPLQHQNNQTTDLLSMEFAQMSFEINNQRAQMQANLQAQHLQTVNTIMTEQANHDMLVQNYVSKLVDLIHNKEMSFVAIDNANFILRQCVEDYESELEALQQRLLEKETIVANLNNELEMIQGSHEMVMVDDAGSWCGDVTRDRVDMNCQICGEELSRMLIFPCKHLSCCSTCEASVYSCPVCETVKESSVEVYWPQMKKQGADGEE